MLSQEVEFVRINKIDNHNGHLLDCQGSRGQCKQQRRCGNASDQLCDAEQHESYGVYHSHEKQCECDVGVEEATGDPVEQPSGDQKAETHGCRDVHHMLDGGATGLSLAIGRLDTAEP